MDAESLIAHLANALVPADRAAFRQAAETAFATSPVCLGPGTIHRIVTSIWRTFFRPPREVLHHMDLWQEAAKQAHHRAAEGQPRSSRRSDRAVSMGY